MVDAADLKSAGGKTSVPVRVRPPAFPLTINDQPGWVAGPPSRVDVIPAPSVSTKSGRKVVSGSATPRRAIEISSLTQLSL
jgi:hypothetical protein